MSDRVAVVGSINRDVVLRVGRIPRPGETVLGWDLARYHGGKGANQAVAVARLGRPVSLIARVGADYEGTSYLRALVQDGVDVDGVTVDTELPTGHATVIVDDSGENAIVVIPGANGRLTSGDIEAAGAVLRGAAVTLAQLEIPLDAVLVAARLSGGIFVLNAAPARPLPEELTAATDVLVVNRTELAALVGEAAVTDGGLDVQVAGLPGPDGVVVTLGAEGAAVWEDGRLAFVPAPAVEIADTTGAGDAFCGGLADALARGERLMDAVRWAVLVGSAATTRHGAQTGMPDRDHVEAMRDG